MSPSHFPLGPSYRETYRERLESLSKSSCSCFLQLRDIDTEKIEDKIKAEDILTKLEEEIRIFRREFLSLPSTSSTVSENEPGGKKEQKNIEAIGFFLNEKIKEEESEPEEGVDEQIEPDQVQMNFLNPNLSASCVENKSIQVQPTIRIEKYLKILRRRFKFHKLLVDIKMIKRENSRRKKQLIGGVCTHIALKSPESYIIATLGKGLKVIENLNQVYSNMLPLSDAWLSDMVYINCLDCYLIDYNSQLYRKDIDDSPPYLFMNVVCGHRPGASFRYSQKNEKLIINKDKKKISVISPETIEVDFEVVKDVGNSIQDFRVFGEEENRVISVTGDGHVLVYRLDYTLKTGWVSSTSEVALLESRREEPASIVVGDKNRYVCLEIGQKEMNSLCSRMIIFKLEEECLAQIVVFDQFNLKIPVKDALECVGYSGKHILWVGLSWNTKGLVQLYDYNTQSGVLTELEEKRVAHKEKNPLKLQRFGNTFYYTGEFGKVMRMVLKI